MIQVIDINYMLKSIQEEIKRARKKFPSNEHQLAALNEEVGELNKAMIEYDRENDTNLDNIIEESVQVAAMAIRLALEGDASFKYGRKN